MVLINNKIALWLKSSCATLTQKVYTSDNNSYIMMFLRLRLRYKYNYKRRLQEVNDKWCVQKLLKKPISKAKSYVRNFICQVARGQLEKGIDRGYRRVRINDVVEAGNFFILNIHFPDIIFSRLSNAT